MMEPEIYSSGFLVFRKRGTLQFLLMKHASRWDLPKGHLDSLETKLQAAKRELFEETGIESSKLWIDPEFEYVDRYQVSYKRNGGKKQLKELTIYLGFLQSEAEILVSEHLGYQWFEWNPPHRIQEQAIDPLLEFVESYFANKKRWADLDVTPDPVI